MPARPVKMSQPHELTVSELINPRLALALAKERGGAAEVRRVKALLASQELHQTRRRAKANPARVPAIVGGPGWYQVDIVKYKQYEAQNRGIKQLLLVICIPSRRAYAYPLKSEDIPTLLVAFAKFLHAAPAVPSVIQGDNQFNAKEFVSYCTARGIEVRTDVAALEHWSKKGGFGDKLGIIDRCVRTLRKLIENHMDLTDNVQWTRWLPTIIEDYNRTPTKALRGRTPASVDRDHAEQQALQAPKRAKNRRIWRTPTFHAGDTVRLLLYKPFFEKGEVRFSRELYTVVGYDGFRVLVQDSDGTTIRRRVRENELQLVDAAKVVRLPNPASRLEAQRRHTAALRAVRSGVVTYDEAQATQSRPAEPRARRVATPSAKLVERVANGPEPRRRKRS